MCRDIYYIAALKICLPHYLHVAFSYTSQRSHTPQYFLIYNYYTFFLQLTVIQSDIVNIDSDAVVHPTSGLFSLSGHVGKCFIIIIEIVILKILTRPML